MEVRKIVTTICRFHKIYLCTLNSSQLFEFSATSSVQDEKYSNLFCKQEIHSSKHCALLVQSQYELIMELEGTVFDDTNSRKCNTPLEHEFLSERPFNYACAKSVVEEYVCRWKKMDAVIREA